MRTAFGADYIISFGAWISITQVRRLHATHRMCHVPNVLSLITLPKFAYELRSAKLKHIQSICN